MKKCKKIWISTLAMTLVCTFATPTVPAYAGFSAASSHSEMSKLSVEPRADVIEWRYKTEGNKVYRREYNYSKRKWLGEWELFGYVKETADV